MAEPLLPPPEEALVVDLTAEVPEAPTLAMPERRPFDPEPQREQMRGWIALALLGMLATILVCSFVSLWLKIDNQSLQTVLTIVVGPLVALVSAATGFYFGSSTNPPTPPSR
jgi:hypothetical protein